mmetsp:Transcript_6803/g.10963  ORF Transcript_6803/g.10963 Transcript_6803/m.10963 type:complete len:91 (-) Transcript_6803:720-992(-)
MTNEESCQEPKYEDLLNGVQVQRFATKNQSFKEMNFGREKYNFKIAARNLKEIGPLHFMVLKLENSEDYEDRINLVRNIESMLRLPRPMI